MTAQAEKIPLENTAVFPTSSPLTICLVVQYDIVDSVTMTYVSKPPINVHVPNSCGVKCLVTISVNMMPVTTLTNPMSNEIRPEYVTRMFANMCS